MTNRDAIILLCSSLCVGENHQPFTNVQISKIIDKLNEKEFELKDLVSLSRNELNNIFFDKDKLEDVKEITFIDRIVELLKRQGSIAFDIMELKDKGIHLLTIYDDKYPKLFLEKLGNKAPAILYYIGNLDLLDRKYIGFSGSRLKKTDSSDEKITNLWSKAANENGYGTITGGATGIDTYATQESIRNNYHFIEFLSDSLANRAKIVKIAKSLQEGRCLLLSETNPYAKFNVGMAMARNKYIYLLSHRTIVVKAQYTIKNKKKTGGTWNGAIENLKSNYTNICVIENNKVNGNKELNELGCPSITTPYDQRSFDVVFGTKYEIIKPVQQIETKKEITKNNILSPEEVEKNTKLVSILKNPNTIYEVKLTEKEKINIEKIKNAISQVEKSIDELSTGNKTTDKKIIKCVLQKYEDSSQPKVKQITLFDL